MGLLAALAYFLSVVVVYALVILHERMTKHLDVEALGVMLFVCILWPFCLLCWLIVKFFGWLEKVVNK